MGRGSVLLLVAVMVLSVAGQHSVLARRLPCDSRVCPAVYIPVCATNGQTYPNECVLGIATCKDRSIRFNHYGKCEPLDCPRGCTEQYEPVCGSDGKTYSNPCFLTAEAECNNKPYLVIIRPGEC